MPKQDNINIKFTRKQLKELTKYMVAVEDKITEIAEGMPSLDVIVPITPSAKRAIEKLFDAAN